MKSQEAKMFIERRLKNGIDYENAELARWFVKEFMGYILGDDLRDAGEEFERRLEAYIENYDPTPWETPEGGNFAEERYQLAARQKRELR